MFQGSRQGVWPGPRCSRCWGEPSSLTVRRPWGPGSALLPPRRPLRRPESSELAGKETVHLRDGVVAEQRGGDARGRCCVANGDDTLSITADCYSTAGTDAAITAALLAYYTSSQVDTLLEDCRTGTAQDTQTTSAITAALLAYYTSSQVDGCWETTAAQDTQTQAAITGALLAYRTSLDQTCSQPIKSRRRWWRTARPPTKLPAKTGEYALEVVEIDEETPVSELLRTVVGPKLASAAERGASRCRLRTTLLPRTSFQVVKPAQAGTLTTPLPESCRAASSARIASRALWSAVLLAESAAFVAYEASSDVLALPPWSAVMLASL